MNRSGKARATKRRVFIISSFMVAHACAAIEVAASCRAVWHLPLYWRATTVYVTLRVEELPTRSVAFTANVRVPTGDVLKRLPFATGPAHAVIPAPPSLHA